MPNSPPAHRLRLLKSVLSAISMGAIVLDHEQRIVLWNVWMRRYSGLSEKQVLGEDFFACFPELAEGRVAMAIHQALANNFPSLLSQSLNKAPFALFASAAAAERQERIQQAIEIAPIAVEGAERHCLIQISDVSIAVAREKLLREQALVLRSQTFSDSLTGVANRRHFDVAIDREHRRARRNGQPLSLLMIDIDHFKPYNDHYGHQKGDQCLIRAASAMAAVLKRPCDLMARYGGEEFGIILPDTDLVQAQRIAEAIRASVLALQIPHAQHSSAQQVTVSIGIATLHADLQHDIETLIGAADRALYQAKHGGRNRSACVLPE
ncbi:MAG: sensor domain-containing diguanylate cyclase [Burkholderiaceae bacterium]|nr:sensor domain-containing diguanylate cyclase [Burkholderiaceae bacterium]